jgi:steroid 5-alpha reductase family enzyme
VICALPHYIGATSSAKGDTTAISIGSAMFCVGLVIETLADYQKWQFKKENSGKFCDAGLVRLSTFRQGQVLLIILQTILTHACYLT